MKLPLVTRPPIGYVHFERVRYSTQQTSSDLVMPYFYFLLDTGLTNAYLLWKWKNDALYNDVRPTSARPFFSYRAFGEAVIEGLLSDISDWEPNIPIGASFAFFRPGIQKAPHTSHVGALSTWCYWCRYRCFQRDLAFTDIQRTRVKCLECQVPLCPGCFTWYHRQTKGPIITHDSGRPAPEDV